MANVTLPFVVGGGDNQKNLNIAVQNVCASFDEKKYINAMTSNKQVSAEGLGDGTNLLFIFRSECRTKLWDMIVGLIDPIKKRTGLHRDPALLAAATFLQTKFSTTAHDETVNAFLHRVLTEFHEILGPLEGAIERGDEAAMLAAAGRHSFMSTFNLKAKWPTLISAVKNTIWQWIRFWARLSQRYNVMALIPSGLFTALRAKAEAMSKAQEEGRPVDLNFTKLALEVLSMTGADEKADVRSLVKPEVIGTIISIMTEQMSQHGVNVGDILKDGLPRFSQKVAVHGASAADTTVVLPPRVQDPEAKVEEVAAPLARGITTADTGVAAAAPAPSPAAPVSATQSAMDRARALLAKMNM